MHVICTSPNYVHNPSLIKPISIVKTIMHVLLVSPETKQEKVDGCQGNIGKQKKNMFIIFLPKQEFKKQ